MKYYWLNYWHTFVILNEKGRETSRSKRDSWEESGGARDGPGRGRGGSRGRGRGRWGEGEGGGRGRWSRRGRRGSGM